uniref:Reelin domain-containing protein n=1 Tax=Stomoxys calcitrans TaxID=35570 RepID=A0A1I8Q462_STOCA
MHSSHIILGGLLLVTLLGRLDAGEYGFYLDDEEIFSKCHGTAANDIHSFLDMSNVEIDIDGASMNVSGYVTIIWDVEPTDRIAFRFELMRFKRGAWQPTIFNSLGEDFCTVMYLETEFWYRPLTSKIRQDERQCVNVKGTVIHLEMLDIFFKLTTEGNDVEGRHKTVLQFEAIDQNGVKRPNRICAEIVGELIRM